MPLADDPQELIGAAVLARRRANEKLVGRETVEAALAELPPVLREEFEGLSPLAWIALPRVEQVQDAIAEAADEDPEALHDRAIRQAQHIAFRSIYRIALRLSTDRWLVARSQVMFSKTRKIGTLVSEIPKPGLAEVVLSDWPRVSDRGIRQIGIGIETLLTLTGRRQVTVEWEPGPEGATFRAAWTR